MMTGYGLEWRWRLSPILPDEISMSFEITKGQYLLVKAPPYYTRDYVYQVTGAGDCRIRAALHGSPRVRKSWTAKELELLIEMGIVKQITAEEVRKRAGGP